MRPKYTLKQDILDVLDEIPLGIRVGLFYLIAEWLISLLPKTWGGFIGL